MVKFGASHHKPGVKTVVREGKTFQTNNKPPRKGENVTDLHFGSYIGREVVYTDIWRLARKMCPATPKPKQPYFSHRPGFGFQSLWKPETPQSQLKNVQKQRI